MALTSQFEILLPELRAYARSITGPGPDAEDLVQDAVERALRADGRPHRIDHLRPWMFKVIRNLHLDELRKRRVRKEYLLREKRHYGEDRSPSVPPRDVLIQLAFERLPPDKREILFLVDVLGMKYAEAADVLGVAQGTVMSRVSRARLALRTVVGTGAPDSDTEDEATG